nr:D-alanyl-D-alanine carboxypeptidase family protein [Paenibacillus protaetiae]
MPTCIASAEQSAGEQPPNVYTHAKASALIDVASGRLLYSSNGDEALKIASLTKIMTAIVAIEHSKLSSVVKTSNRAAGKEGSSIYLKPGEQMKLLDMLYGLMLRSGNDAATAIAEHVGGSEEGFVALMNEKAAYLGLSHTHFMNPHGLDAEGHYSSANDLAKLAAYSLKNPVFAKIVSTSVKTAPNPNDPWDYKWTNKNKMLRLYEGADGVKTGYTKQALRCLVSSATRGGQQLAAVTINDGDDWNDHMKLLDWGFANYKLTPLAAKGEPVPGYALAAGQAFQYPMTDSEKSKVQARVIMHDPVSVQAVLGEKGRLEWYLNDSKIGAVPLVDIGSKRLKLPEKKPMSDEAWSDYKKAAGDKGVWSDLRDVLSSLFR